MPAIVLHNPASAARTREPASLRRLFPGASFVGCADLRVTEATEVAQQVRPGALFAARTGAKSDGAQWVAEAVARGATALLSSRPMADVPLPQCIVPNVARAFGSLCAHLAGRPMRTVRTVGVTGTNGKTTVTWLVRSLLQTAGYDCGLLGTIEYSDGETQVPASLTTPDAHTFWSWFEAMQRRGTGFAAVELSSHALHQDRVAAAELETAIVTNVTHEHLDYHGSREGYLAGKAKILALLRPGGTLVLNQDDPVADRLLALLPEGIDLLTFATKRRAAVTAESVVETVNGLSFDLSLRGRRVRVETPLIGQHNVSNCLAAVAAVDRFGLSLDEIAAGLRAAVAPPGRMQRLCGDTFEVFIDYAHTPDALVRAIGAARALTQGRVIVVVGAGGERDPSKRAPLGRAAAAADVAIITSDNPRGEDAQDIIDAVLAGCGGGSDCRAEPDRGTAIRRAIEAARPTDIVLIAGKGHETTQVLRSGPVPFHDATVAAAAIAQRQSNAARRAAA